MSATEQELFALIKTLAEQYGVDPLTFARAVGATLREGHMLHPDDKQAAYEHGINRLNAIFRREEVRQ
jgi:hypothetical protein